MFKVFGVLVSVFGRKKGGGSTAQTAFEAADAAFVQRCKERHGYTPVKLPDGYAHPAWARSMGHEQAERQRRSR